MLRAQGRARVRRAPWRALAQSPTRCSARGARLSAARDAPARASRRRVHARAVAKRVGRELVESVAQVRVKEVAKDVWLHNGIWFVVSRP